MAKKDKKKKSKKEAVQKPKRIKMLRSEYEKMKELERQASSLLGGENTNKEEEKKNKFSFDGLVSVFSNQTDKDRLMLVRANPDDMPEGSRLGFSVPYTVLIGIISVVLLALYLIILFGSVKIGGAADSMNLIFVIIAHFMATVSIANIDLKTSGLKYTLSNTILAFFHIAASSATLISMHSISSENIGVAMALQIAILIFVVAIKFILNSYRKHEMEELYKKAEEIAEEVMQNQKTPDFSQEMAEAEQVQA